MFTYRLCHFQIFMHSSVNIIIFKIMLIGKFLFYFRQPFCHKILGVAYMLIYQNDEGVHGQGKFGNTCPKPKRGQQR